MQNQKYLTYYVDSLGRTISDTVIKNISLSVSLRVAEESVAELTELLKQQEELVNKQQNEINQLYHMKEEYDNNKHNMIHVDTFRNELIKERDEHQKTREKLEELEYLQLTPAKRKKIDEVNKPQVVEKETTLPLDEPKDGGSF